MKKVLFLSLLTVSGVFETIEAQKISVVSYINQYKDLAILERQRTGIPAMITLGQAIVESENGNSPLAKKSHNHFGIKAGKEWKGRVVLYNDDRKNERFRAYDSVYQSFVDHSNFLRTRERYAFLFTIDPCDYKAWAHGLKKAGYATNKYYAQKLISVIEEYRLYQYDRDPSPSEADALVSE